MTNTASFVKKLKKSKSVSSMDIRVPMKFKLEDQKQKDDRTQVSPSMVLQKN